jgi:PAS domain S-box-containing protein
MVSGPSLVDEVARLAAIDSYAPDSLVGDNELEAITRFAAKLAQTPTALVSLVEADRQRFLAREGLDAEETPRSQSFCQYAMVLDRVMEVRDAAKDPRFAANRLVTGPPHIRFYAGAPLIGEGGQPLGALCVISPEPRPEGLTELQREGLTVLANAVMRRMRDRRAYLMRLESEARLEAMGNAMPQMAWSTPPDGMPDYFNRRWEEFTGVAAEQHFGTGWLEALHPDDRAIAAEVWNKAVTSGEAYEVEYRLLRNDGEWRWTLARGLPMKNGDGSVERWFGTNTDIHESRMMAETRELLAREMGHRIKNIFSLIGGMLHMEVKANPQLSDVMGAVSGRISALARAHDHVRPERSAEGTPTRLAGLLGELFEPYDAGSEPRVRVSGDDMTIAEDAVSPLALLFHELATNAAKYGALSWAEGRVELKVERDGETVRFDWLEKQGPAAPGAG